MIGQKNGQVLYLVLFQIHSFGEAIHPTTNKLCKKLNSLKFLIEQFNLNPASHVPPAFRGFTK